MLKKIAFIMLTLALTACVPIPTEPPQIADCPGGYLDILVEQNASDPVAMDLPGYIDIVRVESRLDDETLTATFHLRDMPENMMFNREGMMITSFEYMYAINVNTDGEPILANHRGDYTLATYYATAPGSKNPQPISAPLQNVTRTVLWKNQYNEAELTVHFENVPVQPQLIVSHQDNTITLISKVPGITQTSTVMFSTIDFLSGQDGVSCKPS